MMRSLRSVPSFHSLRSARSILTVQTIPSRQHERGNGSRGTAKAWGMVGVALASAFAVAQTAVGEEQETEGGLPPPRHCTYLVVGSGTAAYNAVQTLLRKDPKNDVLVVTTDTEKPYMKPALSKDLWASEDPRSLQYGGGDGKSKNDIWYKEFSSDRVTVLSGVEVERLFPQYHGAQLSNGDMLFYHTCLIATGSHAAAIPAELVALDARRDVSSFHTLQDFRKLVELVHPSSSASASSPQRTVAIVGGDALACELALSLARRSPDVHVVHVVPEAQPLAKTLPSYLGQQLASSMQAAGVRGVYGTAPTRISRSRNALGQATGPVAILLEDGTSVEVDHVVLTGPPVPNSQLAHRSGLEVDPATGGLMVNAEMRAQAGIFAAGDVACFYEPELQLRHNVPSYNYAVATAVVAAENMTGAESRTLSHLPTVWSDLGLDGFEAVGLIDASLETVGVWAEPRSDSKDAPRYERGLVYYLKDRRVVGVLAWNVFGAMGPARKLIKNSPLVSDRRELKDWIPIENM